MIKVLQKVTKVVDYPSNEIGRLRSKVLDLQSRGVKPTVTLTEDKKTARLTWKEYRQAG